MKNNNIDAGNKDTNEKIALAVRSSLETFNDIIDRSELFLNDGPIQYSESALEWIKLTASKKVFTSMSTEMETIPEITLESFKIVMGNVQKETGLKGKEIWMPVRSALTGLTEGPELPQVIQIFGKDKIIKLLEQAIEV
jgi:glutamyl/glutaminyl-tRNA synthetase